MATVNEDGSPHNTPYFFMCDDSLEHLYWGSHPDSQHSKNVARTEQIFVVLYDAFEKGGGLFIRADEAHATKGEELEKALEVHNARRAKEGKDPIPLSYYQNGPQRMYTATSRQFWVNASDRDEAGNLIRDNRYEITREDLLK